MKDHLVMNQNRALTESRMAARGLFIRSPISGPNIKAKDGKKLLGEALGGENFLGTDWDALEAMPSL